MGFDKPGAKGQGRDGKRGDPQIVQSENGPCNINDGVHGAYLMKMDLLQGPVVDPGLLPGECYENVQDSLAGTGCQIRGLDDVLNGGIPRGRTTLVSGGPGCGKSILGMEFLYRGALNGEPGMFVTFEERAAALRRSALSLGWDLPPLEETGKFFLMEARVDLGEL